METKRLKTSINLNGQAVQSIIVRQEYPKNVVAKNVPVEKENNEIKRREDLTYVTDNPIYNFEPDGLIFNKPQKLTLYYDDPKGKDEKGSRGICEKRCGKAHCR